MEQKQSAGDAARYASRGVSSSKEEVHEAIKDVDKGLFPNAFCKIVPDYLTGDPNYCLVMHADGAGTKSSLAYIYWKESGEMSVWAGIAEDAIVMNSDDLLCVGVTDNILLSSTIGRNKNRVPGEVIGAIINGSQQFVEKMKRYNIEMVLTGGETADVGDLVKTVIVDSTVCARIERSKVIDNANIAAGDVVVGLASFGQSEWEREYNSGIGSNGLTAARHDLFSSYLRELYPESYCDTIEPQLVYCGNKRLDEIDPISGLPFGKLLLSPTRTYAPIMKRVFEKYRGEINGMIHCSGGGQTKVLNFIDKLEVVKDNLFDTPPLFNYIQESSGTPWREMYQIYNMGHRMELYTSKEVAANIIKIAAEMGVEGRVIGYVKECEKSRVTIDTKYGKFRYEK